MTEATTTMTCPYSKPKNIIPRANERNRAIHPREWSMIEMGHYMKRYKLPLKEHEFDMVRCAGAWLQAQKLVQMPTSRSTPMKHCIETWARLYIHRDAVKIAAHMLGLEGYYPDFNISKQLIRPDRQRLTGIKMAGAHQNYGDEVKDYRVGRGWTYRYDETRMSESELIRMADRVGVLAQLRRMV